MVMGGSLAQRRRAFCMFLQGQAQRCDFDPTVDAVTGRPKCQNDNMKVDPQAETPRGGGARPNKMHV
jgi:hypothetical protein